jgi:hypothetical protein
MEDGRGGVARVQCKQRRLCRLFKYVNRWRPTGWIREQVAAVVDWGGKAVLKMNKRRTESEECGIDDVWAGIRAGQRRKTG